VSAFDPRGILTALERHRVGYVIVGDLAGVLHGSDLAAETVQITPSLKPENIERLDQALSDLGATEDVRAGLRDLASNAGPIGMQTTRGELTLEPSPAGTSGYPDLRRAATREPLGQGIRAPVASAPDLVRILAAQGREQDVVLERRLRRVIEMERTLSPEM
jgi:hypothetical protein